MSARWAVARPGEIPRAGNHWIPVRNHFGITGFGVNAWVAAAEGDEIVGQHTETETGHEELYVVTAGHATFTVDGEDVDAPAGTALFIRDPGRRRKAVAREPGTTILSLGAKPGEAFEVSPIEETPEIWAPYEAGDYEAAAALLNEAIAREPRPAFSYNLACIEVLRGNADEAIECLRRVAGEPRFRKLIATDPGLDSLRDDPRFAELLTPRS